MNKLLLAILAYTYSNFASASDMGGLIYLMGFQVIYILWPMLMPILFLHKYKAKLKAYVILLTLIYGVLGIVNLPVVLFNTISMWLGESGDALALMVMQQVAGFMLSIVCIKKYGNPIVISVISKGDSHTDAAA